MSKLVTCYLLLKIKVIKHQKALNQVHIRLRNQFKKQAEKRSRRARNFIKIPKKK